MQTLRHDPRRTRSRICSGLAPARDDSFRSHRILALYFHYPGCFSAQGSRQEPRKRDAIGGEACYHQTRCRLSPRIDRPGEAFARRHTVWHSVTGMHPPSTGWSAPHTDARPAALEPARCRVASCISFPDRPLLASTTRNGRGRMDRLSRNAVRGGVVQPSYRNSNIGP
jgi:hypothetical protein